MYTGMVQVSYQNSYGKVLKNGWVQVDLPCAQIGEKSMREQQPTNHRSARNVASVCCTCIWPSITEPLLYKSGAFDSCNQ